jgi:hypothetical protein
LGSAATRRRLRRRREKLSPFHRPQNVLLAHYLLIVELL